MKKDEVCIVGIVCVTILEAAALVSHQDGALFAPVVAAISAMVGMAFGIGVGQKVAQKSGVE